MQWSDVRAAHPDEWLVIEAIASHSEGNLFVADDVAVIQTCQDGAEALDAYRRLHRLHPERELMFVHTSRNDLRIEERRWVGIRTGA